MATGFNPDVILEQSINASSLQRLGWVLNQDRKKTFQSVQFQKAWPFYMFRHQNGQYFWYLKNDSIFMTPKPGLEVPSHDHCETANEFFFLFQLQRKLILNDRKQFKSIFLMSELYCAKLTSLNRICYSRSRMCYYTITISKY